MKPALLLLAFALAAGCAEAPPPEPPPAAALPDTLAAALPEQPPATLAYACDGGFRFVADVTPELARLYLPGTTLLLPAAVAASGARFSDGQATYWSRGDEAVLEVGETAYAGCRQDAAADPWEVARLRGVDFRATGNEPGWYLEIDAEGALLLVADYGNTTVYAPTPPPAAAGATTAYAITTGAHTLDVVVEEVPCTDTMSGAAFTHTVTVALDGATYSGCGRVPGGSSERLR